MTLILASASAARAKILSAAGVPFRTVAAEIDETRLKNQWLAEGTSPGDVAAGLARAKALHVSKAYPDALVLGADQTLLFGEEFVSKCPDLKAARLLLSRLRGRSHRLVGGLALARGSAVIWRFGDSSNLKMRDFSDDFLDDYLSQEGEGILSAVGCYKLEGRGAQLFESVQGDYFSILGLPLQPLLAELRKQGEIET